MNAKINLFAGAFLQVFFVAAATTCTALQKPLALAVAAFFLNWTYTANVKRVSRAAGNDRMIYTVGAMSGTLSAYFLVNFLKMYLI